MVYTIKQANSKIKHLEGIVKALTEENDKLKNPVAKPAPEVMKVATNVPKRAAKKKTKK